jgi:ABC-type taurine transport system substrate-binding protein
LFAGTTSIKCCNTGQLWKAAVLKSEKILATDWEFSSAASLTRALASSDFDASQMTASPEVVKAMTRGPVANQRMGSFRERGRGVLPKYQF